MNELVQDQEILMNMLQIIIFLFGLVLVGGLIFYNWLYLSKILKSQDHLGLRPPKNIHQLVKVCIAIPILTAVFILVFMFLQLY